MVQENSKKKNQMFFVEHTIYASPLLHSSFPPVQPTSLSLFYEFLLPPRRPQACCPGERIPYLVCYQRVDFCCTLSRNYFLYIGVLLTLQQSKLYPKLLLLCNIHFIGTLELF